MVSSQHIAWFRLSYFKKDMLRMLCVVTIYNAYHVGTVCLTLQMDDKRHEEFARAKQFKKLNKLLSTPEAKRPITQFRTFALYVLAAVVILQVLCFAVDRVLMNKISKLISVGSQTMTSLTATVQIQYVTTVLWSCFDSYAPPGWNTYSVATREYIGTLYTPLLSSFVSTVSH